MATISEPSPFVWTREIYERAGEAGIFGDLHVELVEGQVLQMSPMKARHAAAIGIAVRLLEAAFGSKYHARSQMPLVLGDRSEPEPDVAIVAGTLQDYISRHPSAAELVVEVSETTLKFDQETKSRLYGEAGIPEYWIVNLQNNQLEVYRKPIGKSGYEEKFVLKRADIVSPVGIVSAELSVNDLLA